MTDRDSQESGAGLSDGQEIPMPAIRPITYEWRKRSWPALAEAWPPPMPWLPALRGSSNLLFAGFLSLAIVAIVGLLLQLPSVSADVGVWKTPLVMLAIAEAGLATIGILLRRLGVAEGVARLIFLVFVLSTVGGLAIIGSVLFSSPPVLDETARWLPVLANAQCFFIAVSYEVLAIVVWALVSVDVRAHRQLRASIAAARSSVLTGNQWRRVTGTPGATLLTTGVSGDTKLLRRTAIAEQLTVPLLNELLVIPGTAIVHRVRFPGSETEHVGHVVVGGGLIALIDSVLWEPGGYETDKWGRVIRNGSISENNTMSLPVAVERYAAAMPDAPIRGWVVVHALTQGELTANNQDNDALVRIATPDSMLREVGDWLATEGTSMNVFALRFALSQRLA
jgi:hypothetical protein